MKYHHIYNSLLYIYIYIYIYIYTNRHKKYSEKWALFYYVLFVMIFL